MHLRLVADCVSQQQMVMRIELGVLSNTEAVLDQIIVAAKSS